VKIHIILTYRAFVGITECIVYKCMAMNNNVTLFYYITAANTLIKHKICIIPWVCACVWVCECMY